MYYTPKLSDLPPILTCSDGTRVTTVDAWETKRRGEILDLFTDCVFGRLPNISIDISHTKERTETKQRIEYNIVITVKTQFGSHSFHATALIPNTGAPCPVFEVIQFPTRKDDMRESAFIDHALERGYALAYFYYDEICTDDNNDFSSGIHAVVKEPDGVRKGNTWGGIASWAWAASRLMDVLETIPEIDCSRAAIVGHSRTAKAALWCRANDPRFGLVCCNESGCTGAAISRGKVGERVSQICANFPCWFCADYKPFGEDEEHMPFDQHMLLALMAPGALYVTSAADDNWSGQEHEFLGAKYCGEAYELYGKQPLGFEHYPIVGKADQSGSVAYHLRRGGHDLSIYDWDEFLTYADKVL